MAVERYSHVMHIVSNVRGRLRDGLRRVRRVARHLSRRAPSPARRRSARWRSSTSWSRCGAACTRGAVGYFSFTGNIDTAIAIRTMLVKNGRVYIQAGGGIVADSDPGAEYEESVNKARAMVRALSAARAFETAAGASEPWRV